MMTSYDGGLVTNWAREMRNHIEDNQEMGIVLEPDAVGRVDAGRPSRRAACT